MTTLFHEPWYSPQSGNSTTMPGARLYFYETGTSTLKSIYSDSSETVELSNPVIADANGRFPAIYLSGSAPSYKAVLKDSDDVTIKTVDPYSAASAMKQPYATLQDMVDDVDNIAIGETNYITERTSGNGGGAWWRAVDATLVTTNNYDIYPGNATVAFQLSDMQAPTVVSTINIRHIGAVDDGTDQQAVLQYALNNKIRFDVEGSFKVDTALAVANGSTITGLGGDLQDTTGTPNNLTKIYTTNAINVFEIIGTSGTGSAQAERITLKNISIDGGGVALSGVKAWDFRRVKLEDLFIDRCVKSIHVGRTTSGDVSYSFVMDNCHLQSGTNGISTNGTAARVFITATGTEIRSMSGNAVDGRFIGIFSGGFFGGNAGNAFTLRGSQNVTIQGLNVENTGASGVGYDVFVTDDAGTKSQSINVTGCNFAVSGSPYGRSHAIYYENCEGGVITGNQFSYGVGNDSATFICVELTDTADNIFGAGNTKEGNPPTDYVIGSGSTSTWYDSSEHRTPITHEVSTGLNQIERYRRNGDANFRMVIDSDGSLEYGDGATTRDVKVGRVAANVFGCKTAGDGLAVGNANTATTSVSTVTASIEVFDHNGASLGHVPVYATAT